MDGRVLQEIFTDKRPLTFVVPEEVQQDERALSESDEAAIMQSLKNLGYIE
jgi:hypothetical protein